MVAGVEVGEEEEGGGTWSLFRTLEDEPYSQCCVPERTYESFGSREGE